MGIPNTTPATALVLGPLPQTTSQDLGTDTVAWYTYTGVPSTLIAGFFFLATLADNLKIDILYGTVAHQFTLAQAINVPFEIPTSNGDQFFFKLTSTLGPPSVPVQISGLLGPITAAVPVGSIGVNDDGNGDVNGLTFPAAFVSGSDASILRFAASAAGEAGTVFPPTGQVVLEDVLSNTVQIFAPLLGTPLFTIPNTAFAAHGSVGSISSDQTTQMYVGGFSSVGTSHVRTMSLTGVVGATDYAIPTTVGRLIQTIAPTPDNTILYYAIDATAAPLKRWDLVNNVALTDFLAGVASHTLALDTLVLADGHVVVGHKASLSGSDSVQVYDASGTLLVTVPSVGNHFIDRLWHAIDDPTSFWIRLYLTSGAGVSANTGVDRYLNIKASDGSTIETFDRPHFEVGVYSAAATAAPDRFGPSFSCPIWIHRGSPPPPPGPICPPSRFGLTSATMGCIQPLGDF